MRCHHRKHRNSAGHNHRGKSCGGTFRKVTQGIADRFGLQRHWVIIGLVVCVIVNPPLALFLFLLAWFWVDHPGKLEGWWHQLRGMSGPRPMPAGGPDLGDSYQASSKNKQGPRESGYGSYGRMEDADPFFQDLKERFDDLERRTGHMEEHVSSEEYELRREFRKMEDDGKV